MNLYFTFELAAKLKGTGVSANALHPRFVASQFGHGGDTRLLALGLRVARPFARSPAKGARTAVWLAAARPWRARPASISSTAGSRSHRSQRQIPMPLGVCGRSAKER
jgi:NAD(P)-dependent dehydrogenase (short-subunit alcohol dehydrogenase family)